MYVSAGLYSFVYGHNDSCAPRFNGRGQFNLFSQYYFTKVGLRLKANVFLGSDVVHV